MAAWVGKLNIVQYLVANGLVDVNTAGPCYMCTLCGRLGDTCRAHVFSETAVIGHAAARQGHVDIIGYLFDRGMMNPKNQVRRRVNHKYGLMSVVAITTSFLL